MKKIVKKLMIIIILIIVLIPIYAFKIEPSLVSVKTTELGKKGSKNQLKVIQLADIHLSESHNVEYLPEIIEKVNNEDPDLIVFTGDLFDNFAKYGAEIDISKYLSQLKAKQGKFAVWGNHDYGGGATNAYEEIMKESGFTLFNNSGETLKLANGKRMFIGGLDDSILGQPSVPDLLSYRKDEDFSLILTHEPDVATHFNKEGVDLILAGHSHGGQVKLPFTKPIKTRLAEKYTKGFYKLSDGTQLFVSSGIGTTRINARFGVKPEINAYQVGL